MGKNKLRKNKKNDTKSTKTIQKLKKKIQELEIDMKRMKLEFSWYEDKNTYVHTEMEEKINSIEKNIIPF